MVVNPFSVVIDENFQKDIDWADSFSLIANSASVSGRAREYRPIRIGE